MTGVGISYKARVAFSRSRWCRDRRSARGVSKSRRAPAREPLTSAPRYAAAGELQVRCCTRARPSRLGPAPVPGEGYASLGEVSRGEAQRLPGNSRLLVLLHAWRANVMPRRSNDVPVPAYLRLDRRRRYRLFSIGARRLALLHRARRIPPPHCGRALRLLPRKNNAAGNGCSKNWRRMRTPWRGARSSEALVRSARRG